MKADSLELLQDPSDPQGTVSKHYVDGGLLLKQDALGYTPANKAGDTFTGPVVLAADPTTSLGAATKQYVDAVAQGLDPKASVRASTTANIALSGIQTIDGVVLVAGDRVLAKNQTNATTNGIYVVAAGAWARSADADNLPNAEVTTGMYTFVEEGTLNGSTGWNLVTHGPIVLGTTALSFTQFGAAAAYTAGSGININGTAISLNIGSIPYDIGIPVYGKPSASTVVFRHLVARPFSFPIGLTASRCVAGTSATASSVFSLLKNGVQFGTITFSAAGTVGVFSAASATSFVAGDKLSITAPSTADATLSDIDITLVSTLS